MKQTFGLIRRPWGVYYLKNKITGEQTTLKTSDKAEAQRLLQARNESESQPHFNLSLARVYLNGADPKLATRTWQEVMEHIVAKKTDETRRRWEVAIKDKNFDCIRKLVVAETRAEHFDRALADGKVSTNVYLRRIHNHAIGMDWLLKSVVPRLQWPKLKFKEKRAITIEEHLAIVAREQNPERNAFYRLAWHLKVGVNMTLQFAYGYELFAEGATADRASWFLWRCNWLLVIWRGNTSVVMWCSRGCRCGWRENAGTSDVVGEEFGKGEDFILAQRAWDLLDLEKMG